MSAEEPVSAFDRFFSENHSSLPFKYMEIKPLNGPKSRTQGDYTVSRYAAKLLLMTLQHSGMEYKKSTDGVSLVVGSTLPEDQVAALLPGQRYNHYTKTFSLGSKEGYHSLMQDLEKQTGEHPAFYPESYLIPKERNELAKAFETCDLWIAKPAGGSRGKGIKIVRERPRVAPGHRLIVQKYIRDPLLINGLKFDLRFYVAVTSVDPLRIYIYDNGLVRLATQPYEENIDDTELLTAHLTNFSINKDEEGFKATDDMAQDGEGSKWSHAPFWKWLEEQDGFDVPLIRRKIEDAIVQVIVAAHRKLKEQANARIAFEMFGFDVMIDKEQNVWILEANVTPALGTSSGLDMEIKAPLVMDYLNLAMIPREIEEGAKVDELMLTEDIKHERVRQFISVVEYEIAERRKGGFRCIFPTIERCAAFGEQMDSKTKNDIALNDYIAMSDEEKLRFLQDGFEAWKEETAPKLEKEGE